MGVSSSISTQQRPLKPRWPGWNPALQGADGSVELHLDTAVPPGTPVGRDGTRPSKARMGVSSSTSTQQCPLKPRWPGWNPALQRANGSVEFHLDTAVPAETPLGGKGPGPPTPGTERRGPARHSRGRWHPGWPDGNRTPQAASA